MGCHYFVGMLWFPIVSQALDPIFSIDLGLGEMETTGPGSSEWLEMEKVP